MCVRGGKARSTSAQVTFASRSLVVVVVVAVVVFVVAAVRACAATSIHKCNAAVARGEKGRKSYATCTAIFLRDPSARDSIEIALSFLFLCGYSWRICGISKMGETEYFDALHARVTSTEACIRYPGRSRVDLHILLFFLVFVFFLFPRFRAIHRTREALQRYYTCKIFINNVSLRDIHPYGVALCSPLFVLIGQEINEYIYHPISAKSRITCPIQTFDAIVYLQKVTTYIQTLTLLINFFIWL